MQVSQIVDELRQHLEQGGQFVASHIPVLVEWAARVEADPLVGAALQTTLGPGARAMIASLIGALEQHEQEAEAAKQAAIQAAVQAADESHAAAAAAAAEPAAEPAPAQ